MINALFLGWVFSLLFMRFNVIGTLSVDNLVAPLLLVLYVFVRPHPDVAARNRRINTIAKVLVAFAILQLITAVKLYTNPTLWTAMTWSLMKQAGYVIMPVLYIRDMKMLHRTSSILVLVAVVTSVAAFTGALGVAPTFAQFDSPLGTRIPGLLRARGFFIAVGDSALVFTYALMLIFTATRKELLFGMGSTLVKFGLTIIILLGVVANQSRNIVLTLLVALLLFVFFRSILRRMTPEQRMMVLYVFFIFAGIMVVLIFYNFNRIFDLVVWSLGPEAAGSVNDRLESYWYSLMLLKKDLLLGLSSIDLNRELEFVERVHNRWLVSALLYGLLGVASIAALCISSVRGAMKVLVNPFLRRQALVIFVFMFSALLFSSNFYGASSYIFWVMLGITLSVHSISTRKEEYEYALWAQAQKSGPDDHDPMDEPPQGHEPRPGISQTDMFLGRTVGRNGST